MRIAGGRAARRLAVSFVVGGLACAAFASPLGPGEAVLASRGAGGASAQGDSFEGTVSNNGRFVAFYSNAADFGPVDGNGDYDVYVRDLRTGAAELVSADVNGAPGNAYSYYPALSANGRWVLYYTYATNIVPSGVPGLEQVVLRDRRRGASALVTVSPEGEPGNGNTGLYQTRPLSGNGRWAVFASDASNLVEGDGNGVRDVFLRDLRRGVTTRISTGPAGEGNATSSYPSISPNGRWVVFVSSAENLVEGDANGFADVFLYDARRRTLRLVSVSSDGAPGDEDSDFGAPAVSNNGRFVAFTSYATNLDADDTDIFADVFLRDVRLGTTRRVSLGFMGQEANGNCRDAAISPNGRFVTYWTHASNMVDATDSIPYDQIVHDLRTGTNRRMLEALGGGAPNNGVYGYFNGFSPNGRWFVVASNSTDVVEDDTNASWDVFRVDFR